ncbi:MAG: F0F1 ATP synthase subunit delta [Candidatus Dormibacteria bacterium]
MAGEVVARRYAEAFFALAREHGSVAEDAGELGNAAEVLAHAEVTEALSNPRLAVSDRVRLALDLLDGLGPRTRNLVRLLVEHGRARILPEVLAQYQNLADAAGGVVRADVTSAIPLTTGQREGVVAALRERFGADVTVSFDEDPAIIGGLVIRAGDRVIDTSIRTQLQQLQASLR